MINRQIIMFTTTALLTTSLILSSSGIFDFSVMGKPVWGPAGKKNAHQIFSLEPVVG